MSNVLPVPKQGKIEIGKKNANQLPVNKIYKDKQCQGLGIKQHSAKAIAEDGTGIHRDLFLFM